MSVSSILEKKFTRSGEFRQGIGKNSIRIPESIFLSRADCGRTFITYGKCLSGAIVGLEGRIISCQKPL
jgi:hypothetical protein